MNRWIWLTPLFILSALWMVGGGCSSNNSPASPAATATPLPVVPTNTPINTATKTPTSTPSSTATNTQSGTPTGTPTSTATTTPTNSPTSTPSSTPTDTPTDTPSVTPVTGCTLLLNDGSNLTVNGNWIANNSTITLSGTNGTTSSSSVDVDVTSGTNYNGVAALDGFTPALLNPTAIIVDFTADASVTAGTGGGYCVFTLQADTKGSSPQYQVNANSVPRTLWAGPKASPLRLPMGRVT